MTFERTVKFNGHTDDDEREELVFETAFNPIRRVFLYEDLMVKAAEICETDAEHCALEIISRMQGGLAANVILYSKNVEQRYNIAKLLLTALSRETDPDMYGRTNKRAVLALLQAREHQIAYVNKAIKILNYALIGLSE